MNRQTQQLVERRAGRMTRFYEMVLPDGYQNSRISDVPHRAIWEGFKANTTAHGIPHVSNARGVIKRSIWFILSLSSLGGCVYNGYLLMDKFFQYPYKVSVEINSKTNMTFPAVSICNNNPIRKSKALCEPKFLAILGLPPQVCSSDNGNVQTASSNPMSDFEEASWTSVAANQSIDGSKLSENNQTLALRGLFGRNDTNETLNMETANLGNHSSEQESETSSPPDQLTTGPAIPGDKGPNNREKRRIVHAVGTSVKETKGESASFALFERAMSLFANMPAEERVALGYTAEEMILECEFQGRLCNATTDFEYFYNSKLGNCYTFNSGRNPDNEELPSVSFRPGTQYGLTLMFNINQSEYDGILTESTGLMLAVHPQNKMPFPDDDGIAISPGHHSLLGARKLEMIRVSEPWGYCADTSEQNFTRNMYEELYNVGYSSNACLKTCYQRHVIDMCDCSDANYPDYAMAFNYTDVHSCNAAFPADDECLEDVKVKFASGELACSEGCPEPCRESSYISSVSTHLWPIEPCLTSLDARLSPINQELARMELADKRENIGKVTVYLSEFNFESVEQSEAYSAFSFISDMGGILGLYIGFSLLSIIEFLELGIDVALLSCCKCSKRMSGEGHTRITAGVPSKGVKVRPMSDVEDVPPPYSLTTA